MSGSFYEDVNRVFTYCVVHDIYILFYDMVVVFLFFIFNVFSVLLVFCLFLYLSL